MVVDWIVKGSDQFEKFFMLMFRNGILLLLYYWRGKKKSFRIVDVGREILEVRTLRTRIFQTGGDKNLRCRFSEPSKEAGPPTS